jgi:hypothetical protein
MFPSFWSRRVNGKQRGSRGRARQQRSRLYLEQLEDRCLLSTYTPGPLVEVSSPDPLADCPPGPKGAIGAGEPDVAVNPANPKNIAAIWIDHGFADNAVGVTLDGGKTWQNVALPLTVCAGGTGAATFDPWVSFAPNGDLYSSNDTFPVGKGDAQVLVTKSTSGGLSWSSPIPVAVGDTPSITADPTDPNYVYATAAGFNPSGGGNGAATPRRPASTRPAAETAQRRCSLARLMAARRGNLSETSTMPPAATSTGDSGWWCSRTER